MEDVLAVYARPHDPADWWCAWTNSALACGGMVTNTDHRQVDWQFTAADARIKLRHLYPNN